MVQAWRTAALPFFNPSSSVALAAGVASLPSVSAARMANSSFFFRLVQDHSVKRFSQYGIASSPHVARTAWKIARRSLIGRSMKSSADKIEDQMENAAVYWPV